MCYFRALVGLFLMTSSIAFAQSANTCAGLNLRSVPVGTQCVTSKQALFQLVTRNAYNRGNEQWKDLTSGLTWVSLTSSYDMTHAITACGSWTNGSHSGDRLPDMTEFLNAEADGFREVLPNTSDYFWSEQIVVPGQDGGTSVDPALFDGVHGGDITGFTTSPINGVICVGP
jgi:hypothetical protein